jgi:hypothetical protein
MACADPALSAGLLIDVPVPLTTLIQRVDHHGLVVIGAAVLSFLTLQELDLLAGIRHGPRKDVAFTLEILWRKDDLVQEDFPIGSP